jgi:hypothetical protein
MLKFVYFKLFGTMIMKYYVYYLDVHFVQHYESHVLRIFRTVQYLSNIPTKGM